MAEPIFLNDPSIVKMENPDPDHRIFSFVGANGQPYYLEYSQLAPVVGLYAPGLSDHANISSIDPTGIGMYTVIGNILNLSVRFNCNPVANAQAVVRVTLPVFDPPINLEDNSIQVIMSGSVWQNFQINPVFVFQDEVNNQLLVRFDSMGVNSHDIRISGQIEIRHAAQGS